MDSKVARIISGTTNDSRSQEYLKKLFDKFKIGRLLKHDKKAGGYKTILLVKFQNLYKNLFMLSERLCKVIHAIEHLLPIRHHS